MKTLQHFMLPEQTNQLYKKEAISSISLTRDIAGKINELIDAYNELSQTNLAKIQEQDGTIRKGILYMKDNLMNSLHDLLELLESSGFFKDYVYAYTEDLEKRIDNFLANVTEGTSTLDAEVIDIRFGYDGTFSANAGESVRSQFLKILEHINTLVKSTITSVETGTYTAAPELISGFIKYESGIYDSNGFDGFYKCTDYISIPFFTTGIVHNFTFSGGKDGYAFYDKNKIFVSGGNGAITKIPENAAYIRITSHNRHTGKYITFTVATDTEKLNLRQLEDFTNILKTSLVDMSKGYSKTTPVLVDGFVRYESGELTDNSVDGYYNRTDYISVPIGTYSINAPYKFSNGSDGYAFFDISKNYISGGKETVITAIPENAAYIAFSNYDSTLQHEEKELTFLVGAKAATSLVSLGKLVTFGDSHVARNGWQSLVISNFDVESHVNLGIGSSTVAINENAEKLPFVDDTRIQAIKDAAPDTIIIIGGTNDVHLDTPLGDATQLSATSKDKTTFYGAYSFLVETLLKWKPTLNLVLCTTPQGVYDATHSVKYSDVSAAIKEIANYYSLPLVDVFGKSGISKTNFSTYSDDEIHLNSLGNARLANLVTKTLTSSYM